MKPKAVKHTRDPNSEYFDNKYLNSIIGNAKWNPEKKLDIQLFGDHEVGLEPWNANEFWYVSRILSHVRSITKLDIWFYSADPNISWRKHPVEYFGRKSEDVGPDGKALIIQSAATHSMPSEGSELAFGRFAVDNSWWEAGPATGGMAYGVFLHELGHGLGLHHPHDGTVFPGVEHDYDLGDHSLNTLLSTVMSYNGIPGGGLPSTFMAFDIFALQEMYGANTEYETGSNTYDIYANGYDGWRCIWDAGGVDQIVVVDLSNNPSGAVIDLRAAPLIGPNAGGYVSKVKGAFGGVTIAHGVDIEHARGGGGDDKIHGNDLDNRISGNSGSDTLSGARGKDTLDGGEDYDTVDYTDYDLTNLGDNPRSAGLLLNASGLSIDLNPETGIARLKPDTSGWPNTIYATLNWLLVASKHEDTLVSIENVIGSTGNDEIKGNDDTNFLKGGDGNDTLYGYESNDWLWGGLGDDSLYGHSGSDKLSGGPGRDFLDGGEDKDGNDKDIVEYGSSDRALWLDLADGKAFLVYSYTVGNRGYSDAYDEEVVNFEGAYGTKKADTIYGSAEDNEVRGREGDDRLYGRGGNDRLYGDTGDDSLYGGSGNDKLYGGEDADHLEGGEGNDTLSGGAGRDFLDGGEDRDTVDYRGSDRELWLDLADGQARLTKTYYVDNGTYKYAYGEAYEEVVLHFENAIGTKGADEIHGTDDSNWLEGYGGNDRLYGRGGKDRLEGGKGADSLYGGSGNDKLYGGEDADHLEGGEGNDTLSGGAGRDFLDGGEDRDTVDYRGSDRELWLDLADGQARLTKTYYVDNGTYKYAYGEAYEEVVLHFENAIGTKGADEIHGTDDRNKLEGYEGDDRLYGRGGNDRLEGGKGADHLEGGEGNDEYVVDNAGDVVVEALDGGYDTVESDVSYTLPTQVEALLLKQSSDTHGHGNELDNVIIGNRGDNALSGGDGYDFIYGAEGSDVLSGGAHADFFVGTHETHDGDTITDFSAIDRIAFVDKVFSGWDVQSLSFGLPWGDFTLLTVSSDPFETTLTTITLEGYFDGRFEASSGSILNPLDGKELPATIIQFVPNTSSISGTDEDDELPGTAGDDKINGLGGDDVLDGRGGADTMEGGPGDDVYVVDRLEDTVIEFPDEGTDTVRTAKTSYLLPDNVEILELLGSVWLHGFGNELDNVIVGNDVPNALFGRDGDDTLDGGGGDDEIFGLRGQDMLTGGADADRFGFNRPESSSFGPSNADVIADFKWWEGDKIDLSAPDITTSFVGWDASPDLNEVGYWWDNEDTIIRFNREGDMSDIVLADLHLRMIESDFIL